MYKFGGQSRKNILSDTDEFLHRDYQYIRIVHRHIPVTRFTPFQDDVSYSDVTELFVERFYFLNQLHEENGTSDQKADDLLQIAFFFYNLDYPIAVRYYSVLY